MKNLIDSLLRVFVAALLAGATVVAVATNPIGKYTVFGGGNDSCGELMESYDKNTWFYRQAATWVTGYATAVGSWRSTPKSLGDVADIDGMMLIIRQHCRNNPLDNLAQAADAMMTQVLKKANE